MLMNKQAIFGLLWLRENENRDWPVHYPLNLGVGDVVKFEGLERTANENVTIACEDDLRVWLRQ